MSNGYRNFSAIFTSDNLATPNDSVDLQALIKLYQPGRYPGSVDNENRVIGTIGFFSLNVHIWTAPIDADANGNSATQYSGKTFGIFFEKAGLIWEAIRIDLKTYSNVYRLNLFDIFGFSTGVAIDPDTIVHGALINAPGTRDNGRLINTPDGIQRLIINGWATEENEIDKLPGTLLLG